MPAKPASPAPAVLTYSQAAAYLGLSSVGALRNMVYRNLAPPSIAYGKRDRRFPVRLMDAWIEAKAAGEERRQHVKEFERPTPPRGRGRPTKAEQIARRRAS